MKPLAVPALRNRRYLRPDRDRRDGRVSSAMQVKKDQTLAITEGEATEFKIILHARALTDFDTAVQINSFKKLLGSDYDVPYVQQKMFLMWAANMGLFAPINYSGRTQWWLGLHGELFDPI